VRHYDAPERDLRSRASVWQRVTGYGAKEPHWLAVRALARFVDRRWPLAVTAVLSTIRALASLSAGWPDADNSGTLDTYRNRTHQMRSKSQAAWETAARCATLKEETDDPNEREYYARLRDAWITLAKRCEFSSISDVTGSEKF
jgi:hypothetical protein